MIFTRLMLQGNEGCYQIGHWAIKRRCDATTGMTEGKDMNGSRTNMTVMEALYRKYQVRCALKDCIVGM